MSYIKIKNPLDSEITLKYKGEEYSIGAKETKGFPQDVVEQWMEIYGFVTYIGTEDEVETKEEVVAKPKKK
jgi:hypothetical protein